MPWRQLELLFVLLLELHPVCLAAATLAAAPQLHIEAGMHTSMVSQIDVDAQAQLLVSGSFDKTVKVWDLRTGTLLSTLRLPFGPGHEGRIYAVAISPDGSLIAASGRTGPEEGPHRLYVLERKTGRVLWREDNLKDVGIRLKFSRDGQRLVLAVGGDQGLVLYRTADGAPLARSTGFTSYAIDIDASGRIVASAKGFVFLYDASLHPLARTKLLSTASAGVAFSPNGQKVAVGFSDHPEVDVLSGKDLTPLFRRMAEKKGTGTPTLGHVAWAADNETLCAAGNYYKNYFSVFHCWGGEGKGAVETDLATNTKHWITDVLALPQGFAFASEDPGWGTTAVRFDAKVFVGSPIMFFRVGDELRLSPGGDVVQFTYFQDGVHTAYFSVPQRLLSFQQPADTVLSPALTASPGLQIVNWDAKHGRKPLLDGRPLALPPLEGSLTLAISPKGSSFLLGTQAFLHLFDRSGHEIWRVDAPHYVSAVNLSADGRLAVAAFGDGTIRWYRAADGKELLAFFPHADRRRWVAWTPSGYYATSVGGEDLIGWQVSRGTDQVADFFPASRFRNLLARPEVASSIITTLDEAEAVAEADARVGSRSPAPVLAHLLPPVVTILSPAYDAAVSNVNLTFRVAIRSPSGESLTAIHTYVDGRPLPGSRGVEVVGLPPPGGGAERIVEIPVQIPPRDCIVAIAAETRMSVAEPVPVRLHWTAPSPLPQAPQLYVLAVGVSSYANSEFKLDLPAKDARDVAEAWTRQQGALYQSVQVKVLLDQHATRNDILGGLEWLQNHTAQKDVAVLFFAGHGLNDEKSGEYVFLPYEADLGARLTTLLPSRDLKAALSAIPGKVLVFLDTCHAGNFMREHRTRDVNDITRVVNELSSADSGVVVFASSTGAGVAQESQGLHNGVFTHALLEALSGKADLDGDGVLRVTEIESYLAKRVQELTGGLQVPVSRKPDAIEDFPVAIIHSP